MNDDQYNNLVGKLEMIIKLLVLQTLGEKIGREAIKRLSSVGFQPKEIADVIGTTPNTVRVALSEMRKKKGGKNVKKTKK